MTFSSLYAGINTATRGKNPPTISGTGPFTPSRSIPARRMPHQDKPGAQSEHRLEKNRLTTKVIKEGQAKAKKATESTRALPSLFIVKRRHHLCARVLPIRSEDLFKVITMARAKPAISTGSACNRLRCGRPPAVMHPGMMLPRKIAALVFHQVQLHQHVVEDCLPEFFACRSSQSPVSILFPTMM